MAAQASLNCARNIATYSTKRRDAGLEEQLFRRIAWRLLAAYKGALTDRARDRAQGIARDADLRMIAPKEFLGVDRTPFGPVGAGPQRDHRLPLPGTLLRPDLEGELHRSRGTRRWIPVRRLPLFFAQRDRIGGNWNSLERARLLRTQPQAQG